MVKCSPSIAKFSAAVALRFEAFSPAKAAISPGLNPAPTRASVTDTRSRGAPGGNAGSAAPPPLTVREPPCSVTTVLSIEPTSVDPVSMGPPPAAARICRLCAALTAIFACASAFSCSAFALFAARRWGNSSTGHSVGEASLAAAVSPVVAVRTFCASCVVFSAGTGVSAACVFGGVISPCSRAGSDPVVTPFAPLAGGAAPPCGGSSTGAVFGVGRLRGPPVRPAPCSSTPARAIRYMSRSLWEPPNAAFQASAAWIAVLPVFRACPAREGAGTVGFLTAPGTA